MTPSYEQLELDLWGDLKTALTEPESADMKLLWHSLDQAIAHSDSNEQLLVAGDAITQIVEVYVKRAKSILDSLEVNDDSSEGSVLDEDFLSGLMRQSMSLDLSDLMEEFTFESESSPVSVSSVVSVIDRKEAKAIARKARAAMRKALKELAEQENIPKWQNAITHWIEQHHGKKVSLEQLQQALGMPLVEIWLGLLHSPTSYSWDGQGEFYREARDFWIGKIAYRSD
ncbi:hypothetical protein [Synechocystis sp. PCC 7509]|uniref:hypothetical protein n=1 Tax=Synechocystis sp. PCC 7509 TaxID=927677 RepID=UPI0002AC6A77|nr:hypothetical protein [Synechocystis sp. PCC 7509]